MSGDTQAEEITEGGWCLLLFHPGRRTEGRWERGRERERGKERKNKDKLCDGPLVIITGERVKIKM